MLDQINTYFGIKPDVDLNVMTHDQSLTGLTVAILDKVTEVLLQTKPHVVMVQVCVGVWVRARARKAGGGWRLIVPLSRRI